MFYGAGAYPHDFMGKSPPGLRDLNGPSGAKFEATAGPPWPERPERSEVTASFAPMADLLSFVCPRCSDDVSAEYYGPCERCRGELRAKVVGEARLIDAPMYEPNINVTPNAVAQKD